MVTATTAPGVPAAHRARPAARLLCMPTAAGSSARPSATAPSCTTRSSRTRATCRPAGPRPRRPGRTGCEPTGTDRLFDFAVGPTSWKHETFPPRVPLTIGRRRRGPGHVRGRHPGASAPRVPRRSRLRDRGAPDAGRGPGGGSGRRSRLRGAAGGRASSSPSSAKRPRAPASARRWGRGPRSPAGSTSR